MKTGETPDPAVWARAEGALAWRIPRDALGAAPRLRWVQALTAGVEGWLERGLPPAVTLTCARGTHRVQMPENILGALFHVTKPFAAAARDQHARRWTRRVSEPLAGKTLGILGLGAIGQEVARKAAALELTVIGTRREAAPVPHVARVFPPDGTAEVLGAADFVLLLLPVTPATRDFMDARRLREMRPTAWLLNYGRGELVVDADLVGAVRAGRHRGRRPRRLPHGAPARRPPVLDDAGHHRAPALRRAPPDAGRAGGHPLRREPPPLPRRRAAPARRRPGARVLTGAAAAPARDGRRPRVNVLSIQSTVAYGRVGNRAAVFALERLGHEVWPIDTVAFSNHPAHGGFRGRVVPAAEVAELVEGLAARGVLGRADAVLSGYLGDAATGPVVADAVRRVRAANPDALYCCDPVIGEVGRGVYVRPGIAEVIRGRARAAGGHRDAEPLRAGAPHRRGAREPRPGARRRPRPPGTREPRDRAAARGRRDGARAARGARRAGGPRGHGRGGLVHPPPAPGGARVGHGGRVRRPVPRRLSRPARRPRARWSTPSRRWTRSWPGPRRRTPTSCRWSPPRTPSCGPGPATTRSASPDGAWTHT